MVVLIDPLHLRRLRYQVARIYFFGLGSGAGRTASFKRERIIL
jgi:hypothetical protein